MNEKRRRINCIVVLVLAVVFFIGCQSNSVKETVQRDLDDLQKQIFELQQDQAYINTKVEQTTAQVSQFKEKMEERDKQLEGMLQGVEEDLKSPEPVQEAKLPPPRIISIPETKKEAQKVVEVSTKPQEPQKDLPTNPRKLYNSGLDLVRSDKIDEAIPVLQKYLELYPRTELADNSVYWLGECYYKKRDFQKAINEFKRVLSDYPSGNKVPSALLKMGYAYVEIRQMPQALEALQRIINQYPNDPVYPLAQKKVDIILSER
ncbi:MAG: tol-pal system protein YbgF [bacterium]